jgi:hypothetical protein
MNLNLNLHSDDQLYQFLTNNQKKRVALNKEIFQEAIDFLTDENNADYFFDFEDRLIEEIIEICKNYPPLLARRLVLKIKAVVCEEINAAPFVASYLKSLRTSVDGAVSAVLKLL